MVGRIELRMAANFPNLGKIFTTEYTEHTESSEDWNH